MKAKHSIRTSGVAVGLVLVAVLLVPFLPGQTTGDADAQGSNGVVNPATALGAINIEPHMLEGTEQWLDLLIEVSGESGVPWQVLAAIMNLESGGDPQVLSPAGAIGLMQVVPHFWQDEANRHGGDLWDPWVNVRTAAEILRKNHETWGTWDRAAAAYFGAIDEAGNITGATDAYGTTGYQYVERFLYNIARVGYGQEIANEYLALAIDQVPLEIAAALGYALSAQGVAYVWAGESLEEGGFDCSGLMVWAFGGAGITLPRTAAEQWEWTPTISEEELLPGDLIFFEGTTDAPGITHVAMYVGAGLMINAPDVDDIVRLVSIHDPWWRAHLVGFTRVRP